MVTVKKGDLIFVYGTLRPGQSAASFMEGKAKHMGTTRIPARLYNLGWFPGIKTVAPGDPADSDMVTGDLFRIKDPSLVAELDSYEGYPNLYDRVVVPTEDGKQTWVYEYNHPVSEDQRISSGDWTR